MPRIGPSLLTGSIKGRVGADGIVQEDFGGWTDENGASRLYDFWGSNFSGGLEDRSGFGDAQASMEGDGEFSGCASWGLGSGDCDSSGFASADECLDADSRPGVAGPALDGLPALSSGFGFEYDLDVLAGCAAGPGPGGETHGGDFNQDPRPAARGSFEIDSGAETHAGHSAVFPKLFVRISPGTVLPLSHALDALHRIHKLWCGVERGRSIRRQAFTSPNRDFLDCPWARIHPPDSRLAGEEEAGDG